jgi:hypothetical protein
MNGRRILLSIIGVALFVAVPVRAPSIDRAEGAAVRKRGAEASSAAVDTTRHVIHVSVDGLRADAVPRLGTAARNFQRLRIEGAFTENARTDYDYTVTLPNHACELTARPVLGPNGHGVSFNSDDPRTIAEVHGSYVAGVFDVVHDSGLRTACYAGKSKFEIFDRSWNELNGALDLKGPDDGRDKIDVYRCNANTATLLGEFLNDMTTRRFHYAFIHFADPDAVGHSHGWESIEYFNAVIAIDGFLGQIFDLIESDPGFADCTWIVVTADHGGVYTNHGDASIPENYTIPFYVWGPGIPAGADLYSMNPETRLDPESERPDHSSAPQPIRNAETANISLHILGLEAIPGSTFDVAHDLTLTPPGGLPCVWITAPEMGATFLYPSDVTVEAIATGGFEGIDYVEFFVNGELAATDDASPYDYVLSGAPFGAYRVTARAVCVDGVAAASSIAFEISSATDVPAEHFSAVMPPCAYPNPASGLSTISFELSAPGTVEITLYDVLGRRVDTVWRGPLREGMHAFPFDAEAHPPGMYLYRIVAGEEMRSGKVMIVR